MDRIQTLVRTFIYEFNYKFNSSVLPALIEYTAERVQVKYIYQNLQLKSKISELIVHICKNKR